jgi:hypothetical protein
MPGTTSLQGVELGWCCHCRSILADVLQQKHTQANAVVLHLQYDGVPHLTQQPATWQLVKVLMGVGAPCCLVLTHCACTQLVCRGCDDWASNTLIRPPFIRMKHVHMQRTYPFDLGSAASTPYLRT